MGLGSDMGLITIVTKIIDYGYNYIIIVIMIIIENCWIVIVIVILILVLCILLIVICLKSHNNTSITSLYNNFIKTGGYILEHNIDAPSGPHQVQFTVLSNIF